MTDVYRAFRQLERLFGYKGPDFLRTESRAPVPEKPGRLIATIIYKPDTEEIVYERAKQEQ